MNKLAKVALLVAFASSADAFQPLGLRPVTNMPSKAAVTLHQKVPIIRLRQGSSNKPAFLQALRASADPVCREKMYDIAQKNFENWNQALKERNYEKAASMYSTSDLSFLPTVSPEFIRDVPSTKRYFADFVKRLPEGKITSDTVQTFSNEAYLHSGMYTFMTGPEDARTPVLARFSYMWKLINNQWKIIHHHSSVVPGKAPQNQEVDLYPVAQENFGKWNAALKAKDFDKVAALYSSTDLSFLPTVSPKFIRDSQSTKEYFMDFLKKLPEGTITSDKVQSYGPEAYLHTGLYTFMVGAEGARQPVEARFSYMWRKMDGEWKIVHHHSSAVPKAPGAQEQEVESEDLYPVAQENFNIWNEALASKDFDKVASLYSSTNLSFLPTVSPKFIRDKESTKEYFMEFLKKLPQGTITSDNVQAYGKNAYLHTGLYTFLVGPEDNRQPVEARFSYMWRKVDGQWKIVHHHSSAVPKTPGTEEQENVSEDFYPIAQQNFKTWNDALASKQYEKVASLYSSTDLSFLPTVSPKFIRDTKEAGEYFMDFLKKLPQGTITSDNVQAYGKDAYLHTGLYTFMVGPEDARQPVEARFSYMWRRINGEWKITHHHSSAVPKAAGAQEEEAKSEDLYPVAQENFKIWNDALASKQYEKVASLYSSKDLSFLPTVSPKFIRDTKEAGEYFMEFLKKLPQGTITSDNVQAYGKDAYLHTGLYTFMVGPEDARQPVEARFSYMWRKMDGQWKIVHHHSSALPGATKPDAAAEKSEDYYPIAQKNFARWNDALRSKDYEKVAALYSSTDLSFLPTVSPEFIRDSQSAKGYFMEFLKKLPEGTITSDNVQAYGDNAYLHTGMYTFMTGPEDNRQPVNARFSYMWKQIDGEWKITHHHSSAVPNAPAGSAPQPTAAEKEVLNFELETEDTVPKKPSFLEKIFMK